MTYRSSPAWLPEREDHVKTWGAGNLRPCAPHRLSARSPWQEREALRKLLPSTGWGAQRPPWLMWKQSQAMRHSTKKQEGKIQPSREDSHHRVPGSPEGQGSDVGRCH